MNQNKFDKIIRIGRIMNSGYFLENYFFVIKSVFTRFGMDLTKCTRPSPLIHFLQRMCIFSVKANHSKGPHRNRGKPLWLGHIQKAPKYPP